MIKACGEIRTILYRDKIPLTFEALVCQKLHSPAIEGTLFIKTNSIKQDLINNTISLHNDKSTVPATTKEAKLPVKTLYPPHKDDRHPLISLKTKQILPGDSITIPTDIADQDVLAEGWKSSHWLPPQQSHIKDSFLHLHNNSTKPVIIKGDKANPIKLTSIKMLD